MPSITKEFIDKNLWNNYVETHNSWAFFQSWDWGEIQKSLGNEVVRWGFFEGKKLLGVAQIILIEAKRGKFLHVRHGPVFGLNNDKLWNLFIDECLILGKERRADFIRVSPMIENSCDNQSLFIKKGFRLSPLQAMDAEICWILNVKLPEETLLSQMRKSTRYLIRHAEKLGITVNESTDINMFLSLYGETAVRQEFVPHKGIKEEFELLSKSNKVYLLFAKDGKKLLAASLFVHFGSQFIYHHSASVPTKTGATHLLQWHAIKLAQKLGVEYYNFWGIAPLTSNRHPWRGITLFKQGFGGEEKRFLHAHDLPLTPYYLVTYAVESFRKYTRGY
ncbi:MAG: peptidoglycan bridge formation glycyltransferase FemA/FemB family protein [Patescibacteria group bacterium]